MCHLAVTFQVYLDRIPHSQPRSAASLDLAGRALDDSDLEVVAACVAANPALTTLDLSGVKVSAQSLFFCESQNVEKFNVANILDS